MTRICSVNNNSIFICPEMNISGRQQDLFVKKIKIYTVDHLQIQSSHTKPSSHTVMESLLSFFQIIVTS